jgi:hypothetical protein
MLARLTFCGLAAFWVTMNVLLWQLEYGARGGDTEVPAQLVWHKILTAPDASSLSVYQNGERTGFCELSTGVGQQMATYDEAKLPPDGLAMLTDYQLHLAGNISLGDFTNRIKFDGRMRFSHDHDWKELSFRISARAVVIEVFSLATNQTAHVKLSSDGVKLLDRNLTFAELENPGLVVRLIGGNAFGDFLGAFDPTDLLPVGKEQRLAWTARRTRTKIANESVPIYCLETSLLGHSVVVDVSTLGEILRIDLPDDISAHIDEWNKP